MIFGFIEKLVGVVDKVVSGNFELSKEELEVKIAKLEERKRKIARELEIARTKQYMRGWVSPERQKEDL